MYLSDKLLSVSLIGHRNVNAFIQPLCPYAACICGDISSVKITSGIYPRSGMGELEGRFIFIFLLICMQLLNYAA